MARSGWHQSEAFKKKLSEERQGRNNPVFKEGVIDKISSSVKKRWEEGVYKDRVNGMLGEYKPYTPSPEGYFPEFLSLIHPITICFRCKRDDRKMNNHHIDEDYNNFLPTNLEPLCVPCHTCFHYSSQKLPFITVGKSFTFAAAHFLPEYIGPCHNLHGHEWKLEVVVKKRIDPETGMVMDFSKLKEQVNNNVITKLDHTCLNDVISSPTAENILTWIWNQLMLKGWLKGLHQLTLWETPNSFGVLRVSDMLEVTREEYNKYWEKKGDSSKCNKPFDVY